ncbi:hypothetical protein [Roseibium sp.]|uniref:hypothetical protein n=1 Tax=Roseibium sp. TaxID=1936156 RepID=UPI003B507831
MYLINSGSASNGLFAFFFIGFVVAIGVILLFQVIGRRTQFATHRAIGTTSSRYLPLLILVMSYLGAAVGLTGGWSRVGVVGDVIPAVLGLIGGLVVYLFENKKFKGLVAIPAALAFTTSIFTGFVVGAEIRNPIDRATAYRDMCIKTLSDPSVLASEDAYCRFLNGPGDQCYRELFKNRMTYESSAQYGDEDYEAEWLRVWDGVATQLIRECQIRQEKLDQRLVDFYQ